MSTYRPRITDEDVYTIRAALTCTIGRDLETLSNTNTSLAAAAIANHIEREIHLYAKMAMMQGDRRTAEYNVLRWRDQIERLVAAATGAYEI